jgi:hypothetical protein
MTTQISEIKTYQLIAPTGRPVRKATMVRFADGHVIKFIGRMTNREAREQAVQHRIREANKAAQTV